MKYIIMAGGYYDEFKLPKQLQKVDGERIIDRTIRLLKENGITDICISSNNPMFDSCGVERIEKENTYKLYSDRQEGCWLDAFYLTEEPVCYLWGDVYFSEEAIKTIVETETKDINFFASKFPFARNYPKAWVEPFALKVVNTKHLAESIEKTKELAKIGETWREMPVIWELWLVINNLPKQTKAGHYNADYIVINDYTSDIDHEEDIRKLENFLKGGVTMIKVEVTETFTLGRFGEVKNLKRVSREEHGKLFKGDTFECTKELGDYLMGKNAYGKPYVKLIEIIPEEQPIKEIKKEPQIETEITKTISKAKKKKQQK